jgi:hypothetical protein
MHCDIGGDLTIASAEERVGTQNHGERPRGDNTIMLAMSSSHNSSVGDEGATADRGED